jgi:hypothetical protein
MRSRVTCKSSTLYVNLGFHVDSLKSTYIFLFMFSSYFPIYLIPIMIFYINSYINSYSLEAVTFPLWLCWR